VGTDVRRIHWCAYVPPQPGTSGGLFLEQYLTPREVCERGSCAAIANDGLANELEGLCFWLHAAMTCQVAGADSPLVVPHPLAPPPRLQSLVVEPPPPTPLPRPPRSQLYLRRSGGTAYCQSCGWQSHGSTTPFPRSGHCASGRDGQDP
jgi:hypothetical protein